MCGSIGTKLRSHSGNEKANSKVKTPILPHTNFSFRAGQITQLISLVDAQFLGMRADRLKCTDPLERN